MQSGVQGLQPPAANGVRMLCDLTRRDARSGVLAPPVDEEQRGHGLPPDHRLNLDVP
ncbi:hypothetical protein ACFFX0_02655 [Citricoccus parietis]|uniref:Uncharacterized protein n=1 Tax=Citricoccus parietis TaxID=592307 RepID=A0ABV5FU37_9MICC